MSQIFLSGAQPSLNAVAMFLSIQKVCKHKPQITEKDQRIIFTQTRPSGNHQLSGALKAQRTTKTRMGASFRETTTQNQTHTTQKLYCIHPNSTQESRLQ